MSLVFDTIFGTASANPYVGGATLLTINVLPGMTYSVFALITTENAGPAGSNNFRIFDGGAPLMFIPLLVGANPDKATQQIERHTNVNGTYTIVGFNNQPGVTSALLEATPLRGSFVA